MDVWRYTYEAADKGKCLCLLDPCSSLAGTGWDGATQGGGLSDLAAQSSLAYKPKTSGQAWMDCKGWMGWTLREATLGWPDQALANAQSAVAAQLAQVSSATGTIRIHR